MEATTNKILLSRVNDLVRLCEKYSQERFSAFLDGGELAVIEDSGFFPYGFNVKFFGGYADSEKKILGVFPEWSEPEEELFPISVLKIESSFMGGLSHRDYLGSILGLGLEPCKTGDILVDSDKSAYCFVCSDIADYIKDNLKKIGSAGVSVKQIPLSEVQCVKRNYQRMNLVCASLRTDAIVGAVCKLSRQKASELVACGKVKINHRPTTSNAAPLKEGDLISVRGFGRFILRGEGAKTRNDRLHIAVDKFV